MQPIVSLAQKKFEDPDRNFDRNKERN